jgi:hypothetical protein
LTELHPEIHLVGQYTVALKKVVLCHTWHNVSKQRNQFFINDEQRTIAVGHYEKPSLLIAAIKDNIPDEFKTKVKISTAVGSGRVKISVFEGVRFVIPPESSLGPILGFPDGVVVQKSSLEESGNRADATVMGSASDLETIKSVYIYSDIVTPRHVGHLSVPLLGIATISGKRGDCTEYVFHQPTYVPVRKKVLNSIELKFADISGALIDFEHGENRVELSFAPVWQTTRRI